MDAPPDAPTGTPVSLDAPADRLPALQSAVQRGDLAACRALLDADPALASAPSTRGGSLFLEAYERECYDIAALFEERLATGSRTMVGMTVHEAAAMGRPAALRHALTEDMLCFEEIGPAGFAPLHRASYRGQPEAVRLLLEVGADPAQRSANGARLTPLHSAVAGAARFGASAAYQQVVDLLLVAGASPDAEMQGDWTPRATAEEAGLRIDGPEERGQTPSLD